MGNLFGIIEEKKCTSCGVVKPKAMFGVVKRTARPGRIGYESKCRECKRAYDVERGKCEERKRNLRAADKKRAEKKALLKAHVIKKQGIPDTCVGTMCRVAWCKCVVCGDIERFNGRSVELSSLSNTMCKGCYRSMVNTGVKAKKEIRACVDCGGHTTGTAAKMRCSACARKRSVDHNRHMRKKGIRSDRRIVERARKHGVVVGAVNRVKVYDRDGWACYVCGVQVVRSKDYRPDQATLDHIVPLSLGGPHTYDNVRTCCHRCNSTKSNTMPGGGVNL